MASLTYTVLMCLAALAAVTTADVTICTQAFQGECSSDQMLAEDCTSVETIKPCIGYCAGAGLSCESCYRAGTSPDGDVYARIHCVDACFPAKAKVTLESGESKPMNQVEIGDRVEVGHNKFSDVYMFSHNISKIRAEFVEITTSSTSLRLTASHYLYFNGELVPAYKVKVGGHVQLANGTAGEVVAVNRVSDDGIFNPHTLHGDIVVDGVVTSTYTTAVHPTVAHAILAPLRLLYQAGINVYSAAIEDALPLLKFLVPHA